jgi:hypothetical protein
MLTARPAGFIAFNALWPNRFDQPRANSVCILAFARMTCKDDGAESRLRLLQLVGEWRKRSIGGGTSGRNQCEGNADWRCSQSGNRHRARVAMPDRSNYMHQNVYVPRRLKARPIGLAALLR